MQKHARACAEITVRELDRTQILQRYSVRIFCNSCVLSLMREFVAHIDQHAEHVYMLSADGRARLGAHTTCDVWHSVCAHVRSAHTLYNTPLYWRQARVRTHAHIKILPPVRFVINARAR